MKRKIRNLRYRRLRSLRYKALSKVSCYSSKYQNKEDRKQIITYNMNIQIHNFILFMTFMASCDMGGKVLLLQIKVIPLPNELTQ